MRAVTARKGSCARFWTILWSQGSESQSDFLQARREYTVRKGALAFFAGFFAGVLAAGATVLLFAPLSGEKVRAQIREKGVELRERAGMTYAEALKGLESAIEETHKKVKELSAKVDQSLGLDREELARWNEELAAIEEASEEALAEARMG
jgi:gas vesicle protein